MKMIKRDILISLISGVIFVFFSYKLYQSRLYSFHFVDEDHHTVIASLLDKDTKLYKNISTNHQPLPFYFSYLSQKVFEPTSIKQMIKINRLMVFIYGLIWYFIFLIKFKKIAWPLIFLFEMVKYLYFGNLVLAESLAAYPVIFLVGISFKFLYDKLKFNKIDGSLIAISVFIVTFNLLPLWPFLLAFEILLFLKNRKLFWFHIRILLTLTMILFLLTPFNNWYEETIYNNIKYAIPYFSKLDGNISSDILAYLILPFTSVLNLNTMIGFCIFLLIILSFISYKQKKVKVKKSYLIFLFFLTFLINNRVKTLNNFYYEGFHLLPWIGGFIMLCLSVLDKFWKNKLVLNSIFIAIFIFSFHKFDLISWWQTDAEHEYYVNFSEIDDYNFAIKNLALENENLFVNNITPLLYWQSLVKPIARQVDFYPWQYEVEKMSKDFENEFKRENPEFVFGVGKMSDYVFFEDIIMSNYVMVKKNEGKTPLFIRKDKYEKINDTAWETVAYRGFGK
jgi:hypothetical protein